MFTFVPFCSRPTLLIVCVISLGLVLSVPALATVTPDNYSKLETEIASGKYKKITSILIQQRGNLVYEKYFGGATIATQHNIRSASKSFTSMLFGIALNKGAFKSVHDKVLPLFEDYQPVLYFFPAKSEMTFDHLMSMTSPLECNDSNRYSSGNEERMYLRKDWLRFVLDLPERGNAPWESKPQDQPYGRSFSYCTAGVFLVGAAIERQTDLKLSVFAQRNLFDPLDIKDAIWPESPMGITQSGGGVSLSSQSMIKIGQVLLNDGKWRKEQLISQDWIQSMFTPYSDTLSDPPAEYGYLWWIESYEIDGQSIRAFTASGNGGNKLIIVPQLDLTAVITSVAFNSSYMHSQVHDIIRKYILPNANLKNN